MKVAIAAEVAIILVTIYVALRWLNAAHGNYGQFSDLVPYNGSFLVVVAPWLFASAFIPLCWIAWRMIDGRKKDT